MVNSGPKVDSTSNAETEGDSMRLKFVLRDGIHVEQEFSPSDTVETVIKALQTKWPADLDASAPSYDRIRLICMGKGILGPASSTLEEVEVPVFLTHPTPINVSVKPVQLTSKQKDNGKGKKMSSTDGSNNDSNNSGTENASSGDCCCVIL